MAQSNDKLTEFVTVLGFALAVGGISMLSILNLSGIPLAVTLSVVLVATIASWSYLRKRFHRY